MPELVDYYTVLGVPSTASVAEIRKARQRLAMLYHPDRNKSPAANQMMALVNRAADVLLDPSQRSRHDAQLAREDTIPAPPPTASHPAAPSPGPAPHHAPTYPSLLARALRSALMHFATALAWAIAIAFGVAGLVLASGTQFLWLRLLVLVSFVGISYVLPSAMLAGARRILYGPTCDLERDPSARR